MGQRIISEDIVAFLQELLPQRPSLFAEIEKECEQDYIPLIEPEIGQLLQVFLGIKQAKRVLEIGTGIGYSTLWLALAPNKEKTPCYDFEINNERYEACYYFEKPGVSS